MLLIFFYLKSNYLGGLLIYNVTLSNLCIIYF